MFSRSRRKADDSGFTLIEMLIALVVVSIILSSAVILVSSLRANGEQKAATEVVGKSLNGAATQINSDIQNASGVIAATPTVLALRINQDESTQDRQAAIVGASEDRTAVFNQCTYVTYYTQESDVDINPNLDGVQRPAYLNDDDGPWYELIRTETKDCSIPTPTGTENVDWQRRDIIASNLTSNNLFTYFDDKGVDILAASPDAALDGTDVPDADPNNPDLSDLALIRANIAAASYTPRQPAGVIETVNDTKVKFGLLDDGAPKLPNTGVDGAPSCPAWINVNVNPGTRNPVIAWADVADADRFYIMREGRLVLDADGNHVTTASNEWEDEGYDPTNPRFVTYSVLSSSDTGVSNSCPTITYVPANGAVPVLNMPVGPNVNDGSWVANNGDRNIGEINVNKGTPDSPTLNDQNVWENEWVDTDGNRLNQKFFPRWTKVPGAYKYEIYYAPQGGEGNDHPSTDGTDGGGFDGWQLHSEIPAGQYENDAVPERHDCNVRGIDLICPPGIEGNINEDRYWMIVSYVEGTEGYDGIKVRGDNGEAYTNSSPILSDAHRQTVVSTQPRYETVDAATSRYRPYNHITWEAREKAAKYSLYRVRGNSQAIAPTFMRSGTSEFLSFDDYDIEFGEGYTYYVIITSRVGSNKVYAYGPPSDRVYQLQYPPVPDVVSTSSNLGGSIGNSGRSGNYSDGVNQVINRTVYNDGASYNTPNPMLNYHLRRANNPRNLDAWVWDNAPKTCNSNSCKWRSSADDSTLTVYDVVAENATGFSPNHSALQPGSWEQIGRSNINDSRGVVGDRAEIYQRPDAPSGVRLIRRPVVGTNSDTEDNRNSSNSSQYAWSSMPDSGLSGGWCFDDNSSDSLYRRGSSNEDGNRAIRELGCSYRIVDMSSRNVVREGPNEGAIYPGTSGWNSVEDNINNRQSDVLRGYMQWGARYNMGVMICNHGGCSDPTPITVDTYPGPFGMTGARTLPGRSETQMQMPWRGGANSTLENGVQVWWKTSANRGGVRYSMDVEPTRGSGYSSGRELTGISSTTQAIRIPRRNAGIMHRVTMYSTARANGLERRISPETVQVPPFGFSWVGTDALCTPDQFFEQKWEHTYKYTDRWRTTERDYYWETRWRTVDGKKESYRVKVWYNYFEYHSENRENKTTKTYKPKENDRRLGVWAAYRGEPHFGERGSSRVMIRSGRSKNSGGKFFKFDPTGRFVEENWSVENNWPGSKESGNAKSGIFTNTQHNRYYSGLSYSYLLWNEVEQNASIMSDSSTAKSMGDSAGVYIGGSFGCLPPTSGNSNWHSSSDAPRAMRSATSVLPGMSSSVWSKYYNPTGETNPPFIEARPTSSWISDPDSLKTNYRVKPSTETSDSAGQIDSKWKREKLAMGYEGGQFITNPNIGLDSSRPVSANRTTGR